MATNAATSASVVVVDAKSAAEERDMRAREALAREATAPPALVSLSGIAHTIPYALTVVTTQEKYDGARHTIEEVLRAKLDDCHAHLNEWNPESEVSRINALPVGQELEISKMLLQVFDAAARVTRTSGGAFDIGAAPIVEKLIQLRQSLGQVDGPLTTAQRAEVNETLAYSSFVNGFHLDRARRVIKRNHPGAKIFLGGINKGYTVDAVIDALRAAGFNDALLEWGGDVRGSGRNHHGHLWRVGILAPPTLKQLAAGDSKTYRDPDTRRYIRVCTLDNEALATSGDYESRLGANSLVTRIFNNKAGDLVIASDHHIGQASVKSTSCMIADALATVSIIKRDFNLARWHIDAWRYARDAATDFTFFMRDQERMAVMHEIARETADMKAARVANALPARVVVIGGGLAGCSAAIEAARCGASVVLLEKTARLGGNSAKATSGMNGWGTTSQGNLDISDDGRFFERDTFKSGDGGTCDTGLVKTLSVKSAESVHWVMRETGLSLTTIAQLGGHSRPRTHRAPNLPDGTPVPIGYSIMSRLAKKIQTEFHDRIKVMTSTVAVELLHTKHDEYDGSTRLTVTGVKYRDEATKAEATLTADSVILTTGGFGNDHTRNSLLQEFAPDLAAVPTTNGDFATGDGVKMARDLGVALIDMDKVQLHPTGLIDPKAPNAKTKFLGPEALRGSGGILVNRRGKRFTNELGLRSVVSKAVNDQNDEYPGSDGCRYACCILNAAAVKLFGAAQLNFYKDKQGLFKDAADVAALAEIVGCDEATLRETLEAYGKASKAGRCNETKKTVFPCVIDATGPFVVAFITPSIHYTMGGVAINPAAEVQLVDHSRAHGELFGKRRSILGLFAAGEVTAGVHGANRLGGNSLLECVVYGRIAGDRAATILQRSEAALSEHVWTPVVLREVREGTGFGRGSVVLRFNMPGAMQMTGLKLGQFVAIRGDWDGQQLVGYYSPITLPNERGVIGLLARKDKGSLREWITALRPGDAVYMKACPGIAIERVPERAELIFEGQRIRKFGFVAGGTGIAPMLQIIRAATKRPYAAAIETMRLIYAAETEEELTYEKVLLDFERSAQGKFKATYVLNDPPPGWTRGVGFVDAPLLQATMPQPADDVLILICGPPVMQNAVMRAFVKMGHNPNRVRTVDDAKPVVGAKI